jgi:hypothetical protein
VNYLFSGVYELISLWFVSFLFSIRYYAHGVGALAYVRVRG